MVSLRGEACIYRGLDRMECNEDGQICTMTTSPAETIGKVSVVIQYEILPRACRQPDPSRQRALAREDEASHFAIESGFSLRELHILPL